MCTNIWTLRNLGVGLLLRVEIVLPFCIKQSGLAFATASLMAIVNLYVEKMYRRDARLSRKMKILLVGAAIDFAILGLFLVVEYWGFWIGGGLDRPIIRSAALFMLYLWLVTSSLTCVAAWVDSWHAPSLPKGSAKVSG